MRDLLSEDVLCGVDRIYRLQKASRAININELDRMLANAFLTDERPWPIQKLEHHTGYTRAAIRKHLVDYDSMGIAERRARQGWVLTPLGQSILSRAFSELLTIANGNTNRFSAELLDLLGSVDATAAVRPLHTPLGDIF